MVSDFGSSPAESVTLAEEESPSGESASTQRFPEPTGRTSSCSAKAGPGRECEWISRQGRQAVKETAAKVPGRADQGAKFPGGQTPAVTEQLRAGGCQSLEIRETNWNPAQSTEPGSVTRIRIKRLVDGGRDDCSGRPVGCVLRERLGRHGKRLPLEDRFATRNRVIRSRRFCSIVGRVRGSVVYT